MTSEDQFDEAYYQANGQSGDRPALRWYARLARRYLGRGPALDVGCGTGHLMRRLAADGEAGGLEVSQYSAAAARVTSPGSTVVTEPAELPDAHFDRFTAIHVVEHLDDDTLHALLGELRRSAAPGAGYLIVTPDSGGRAYRLHGQRWNALTDPTHINLKTHAQWREYFQAEGFTVEREGSDGLWNVPYSKLPKLLDAALHAVPSLTQFLLGRLFLKPGSGESSVFILR